MARPRDKRTIFRRARLELSRFNGRTREGVRIRQLEKLFRTHLGDIANTPVATLAIRRAAELMMITEKHRGALIRGESVDLGHLLRLEGVCARAISALGMPLTRRDTSQPSLADYLADLSDIESGNPADD
jgi:hypothetical protein